MSVTPAPATVAVKYESPHIRALGSAQRAALAGLASSILAAIIPALIEFIQNQDFSVTALRTLGSGVGITALTTIYVYLQKRSEASNEPVVPVPSPTSPASPSAIFAPPITADTLRGLLETVDVLQEWTRPPEPPPATISHRVVTPTPPILGAVGPVKRSRHAASGQFATGGVVTTTAGVGDVTQT
jgi:hypothetical protein